MEALIANPAFGVSVLPLVAALGAALLIWLVAGPYRAPQIIFAAALAGMLAAYWWLEKLPRVVPVTGQEKLFYFIILLLAAGWAIDGPERRPRRLGGSARLAMFGLPALALVWVAWGPLVAGPDGPLLGEMAVLWLVAVLVHWRLQGQERAGALVGGVQLMVAAVGLAVVAAIGAAASLAALAGAVAAAMAGVLLWLYVLTLFNDERFGFGALGWLASAGVLLFIGDLLVLVTPDVNRWSLALLLLVFLADKVPSRRRSRGAMARVMNPLVLIMMAAVPVAAAVGLAMVN